MSKQRLTEWFSSDVKPLILGVYQTGYRENGLADYSYWDGKGWGLKIDSIDMAEFVYKKYRYAQSQNFKWRGLAEDPAL